MKKRRKDKRGKEKLNRGIEKHKKGQRGKTVKEGYRDIKKTKKESREKVS